MAARLLKFMRFSQKLINASKKNNSLLCVGLDSDLKQLPATLEGKTPQYAFNRQVIEATGDLVCGYKLNSAFYEAVGEAGIAALKQTCDYLKKNYPALLLILDAKRGDIGATNEAYAQYVFGYLGADAVTLQPYLGGEALVPFLERQDKGCFILCRTSNSGAGEFQDLRVGGRPLYQIVAGRVATTWNKNNNCGLVVGATYPREINIVRRIAKSLPLLIPGVGSQGGDLTAVVKNGLDSQGSNIIINVSRAIIFASKNRDFAPKARAAAQTIFSNINKVRAVYE